MGLLLTMGEKVPKTTGTAEGSAGARGGPAGLIGLTLVGAEGFRGGVGIGLVGVRDFPVVPTTIGFAVASVPTGESVASELAGSSVASELAGASVASELAGASVASELAGASTTSVLISECSSSSWDPALT